MIWMFYSVNSVGSGTPLGKWWGTNNTINVFMDLLVVYTYSILYITTGHRFRILNAHGHELYAFNSANILEVLNIFMI